MLFDLYTFVTTNISLFWRTYQILIKKVFWYSIFFSIFLLEFFFKFIFIFESILFFNFLPDFIFWFLIKIVESLLILGPMLLALAFFTLAERKLMASFHRRRGPNVRGIFGVLQPFADALKLITKEVIEPSQANRILYLVSPIMALYMSVLGWALIPFDFFFVFSDINLGLIYIFMISGLGVYSILLSGWASNSKYSFLGSLRAAAQMISYEIAFGVILVNVLIFSGSLNLTNIVLAQKDIWFIFPLFPAFLMFYVTVLAEINRTPFDLPEAEGELVSGYNIEYSAMGFGFFFMAENVSFLLMGSLIVVLFLGGWYSPTAFLSFLPGYFWFMVKLILILFSFVWIRCTLPRYRYDQLMFLCWKVFFPLSTGLLLIVSSLYLFF